MAREQTAWNEQEAKEQEAKAAACREIVRTHLAATPTSDIRAWILESVTKTIDLVAEHRELFPTEDARGCVLEAVTMAQVLTALSSDADVRRAYISAAGAALMIANEQRARDNAQHE